MPIMRRNASGSRRSGIHVDRADLAENARRLNGSEHYDMDDARSKDLTSGRVRHFEISLAYLARSREPAGWPSSGSKVKSRSNISYFHIFPPLLHVYTCDCRTLEYFQSVASAVIFLEFVMHKTRFCPETRRASRLCP